MQGGGSSKSSPNSPADSTSLSSSSRCGDTQHGCLCTSPSYAVPRLALQRDTILSPLSSEEEFSRVGWEHPILPAHLEVPLCWARQPREQDKWTGLGSFNKADRWPLSELSPALALSCCPSSPAHLGLGAAQPSPSKALLLPQNTTEPQAQGSLNTLGNRAAPSNRQLFLQARTCDSPPCMPIPGALGQREDLHSTHGTGEAVGPPAPARASLTTQFPRGKARKVAAGARQVTWGGPNCHRGQPASSLKGPRGPSQNQIHSDPFSQQMAQGPFQHRLGRRNRETEAHSIDTQQHWAGTVFPKVTHTEVIQDTACPFSPSPKPLGVPKAINTPQATTHRNSRPTACPGHHSSVFTLCIKSFWSIFSRS